MVVKGGRWRVANRKPKRWLQVVTVKLGASCHSRFLYPWRMPRHPVAPSLRWKLSGIAPSTIHKSSTSIFPPPTLIPSSPFSAVFHPSLFILKWQLELHVSLRGEQVKREKACQIQPGDVSMIKSKKIYMFKSSLVIYLFLRRKHFSWWKH